MYRIILHKMNNSNDEYEEFEKLEDAFYVFMQLYNKYIGDTAYDLELEKYRRLKLNDHFDKDMVRQKIQKLAKKKLILWSAVKLNTGLKGFAFETEEGLRVISVSGEIQSTDGWLFFEIPPIKLPIVVGGLGYDYKIILKKI